MELKRRSDIHYARKCWHMLGVSLMALVYQFTSASTALILLGLLWIVAVPLDIARQRNPQLNQLLLRSFKPIMREYELNRLAGTSYLLTGVALIVILFPHDVVMLSLLFLALADPIASVVGIKFGKDKIFGHKSLQGSFAAFVICAALTFAYLYAHALLLDRILVVSLLGGVIGCVAELVPIAKIDDNFTMPVVSATSLWILFYFFGMSSNSPLAGV